MVEYIGTKNLLAALKSTVALRDGKVLFGFSGMDPFVTNLFQYLFFSIYPSIILSLFFLSSFIFILLSFLSPI